MNRNYDLIVIGGGPAGLAAALSGWEHGLRKIAVVERDKELGGILNQCIHNGFGLHYFKQELTGPEYAERFIRLLKETRIEILLDTMALEVTPEHDVRVIRKGGAQTLHGSSVILCMGCRERTRGAIAIPGNRPAGVLTAGAAQRYMNLEGYMVGRRVVILGSGDIGLIMARRMTLEGAKVLACLEVMPYSGGLTRNIVQCLEDYDIPLYLSHTITDIQGTERVERVVAARVDENRQPIPGTERTFECDTVLLSVGLIPENELSRGAGVEIDRKTGGAVVYENLETSIPGVFACGNALHVHDLVDFVTAESRRAGEAAARYVQQGSSRTGEALPVTAGENLGYAVPQRIHPDPAGKTVEIFFRVNRVLGKSEIHIADASGELLARFPRERMAPGEMERIHLAKTALSRVRGGITITAADASGREQE